MRKLIAKWASIVGFVGILPLLGSTAWALNPGAAVLRNRGTLVLGLDSALSDGTLEISYVRAAERLKPFFLRELRPMSSELSDAQIIFRAALEKRMFSTGFSLRTIRNATIDVLRIRELTEEFTRQQREILGASPLAQLDKVSLQKFLLYFQMWVAVHFYGFESQSGYLAKEARYYLVKINSALENLKDIPEQEKKTYLDQLLVFAASNAIPQKNATGTPDEAIKIRESVLEFVRSLESPSIMGEIFRESDQRERATRLRWVGWTAAGTFAGFFLVRWVLSGIYPETHSFWTSLEDPIKNQVGVGGVCSVLAGYLAFQIRHSAFTQILCESVNRFRGAVNTCEDVLRTAPGQTSFVLDPPQSPTAEDHPTSGTP